MADDHIINLRIQAQANIDKEIEKVNKSTGSLSKAQKELIKDNDKLIKQEEKKLELLDEEEKALKKKLATQKGLETRAKNKGEVNVTALENIAKLAKEEQKLAEKRLAQERQITRARANTAAIDEKIRKIEKNADREKENVTRRINKELESNISKHLKGIQDIAKAENKARDTAHKDELAKIIAQRKARLEGLEAGTKKESDLILAERKNLEKEILSLQEEAHQKELKMRLAQRQAIEENEIRATQKEQVIREKALQAEIAARSRIQKVIHRAAGVGARYNVTDTEWSNMEKDAKDSRLEFMALQRTIGKTTNGIERFGFRIKSVGKDVHMMERRLGNMGRAMIGLAIASVIVFMQSFLSSLVAVAGAAAGLAASLTSAATVLGGSFVSAIATALPMVALLAGAFQRLSLINDAIQQQKTIDRQNFGPDTAQATEEASNQEAIADAKEGVKEATEALSEARRQARKDIQDLMLAERAAEIQFRDSKWSLEDAIQGGDVGGLASAQLDVDTSRLDRNRARAEAASARKGGVGGMEGVIDATKALQDAQEGLADAHKEAGTAAAEQTSAESDLGYELAQLTEAEKELMRNIQSFTEELKETYTPITDILISAFSYGLDGIEKILFDNRIIEGSEKLAEGISHSIRRMTNLLSSDKSMNFWATMLDEGEKNLGPLTDIAANLFRIFRNLAEGAAPVFRSILRDIADLTEDWAKSTNDIQEVTDFFRQGEQHLSAWARLLGSIIGWWHSIMDVSSVPMLGLLSDITDRVDGWKESIQDNREESEGFFEESRRGFMFLIDILERLALMFYRVFDADTIGAFSRILDNVLIPAFEHAIIAIGGVIKLLDWFLSLPIVGTVAQWGITFGIVLTQVKLLGGALYLLIKPLLAVIELLGAKLLGGKGLILAYLGDLAASFGRVLAAGISTGLTKLGALVTMLGASGLGAALKTAAARILLLSRTMKIALAGTAIGLVLTGLALLGDALGLFGDDQEEAKVDVEATTQALRDQRTAMDELRDAARNVKGAKLSAQAAEQAEESAREAAEEADKLADKAEKRWGARDARTIELREDAKAAETAYKQSVLASNQANDDARRAERDRAVNLAETWDETQKILGQATGEVTDLESQIDDTQGEIDNLLDLRKTRAGGDPSSREYQVYTEDINALIEKREGLESDLTEAISNQKQAQKNSNKVTEENYDLLKQTGPIDTFKDGVRAITRSIIGTGKESENLGEMIKDVTNKVLKGFGADELKFDVPKYKTSADTFGFASGGWFGSPLERKPDDRLIAVGGGEAILTGHHQAEVQDAFAFRKAITGQGYGSMSEMFAKDQREHRTAPKYNIGGKVIQGFSRGGATASQNSIVPVPGFPGERIGSSVLNIWNKISDKFHLFLTDAFGPGHQSPGHTVTGTAVDIVPMPGFSWDESVNKAVQWAVQQGLTVYYDGQFGSTPLADHGEGNHAHIELAGASGAGISASIAEIKRLKIGGPDSPLKDILQHLSDKHVKAANKKIAKETMVTGGGGNVDYGGGVLSEAEVRRIFLKAFRITGVSPAGGNLDDLMNLAMEESSWNPGAENKTAAGVAAGGPQGILQVVGATFAAAAAKAREMRLPVIPTDPFNPLHSAIASIIYQMGAYGDIQRHAPYARGGVIPEFDDGGVVPGPVGAPKYILAHGGETVLPTHKFAQGGEVPQALGKIRTQTGKLSGVDSIDKFVKIITDLLREGGLFDDFTTALESFVAQQTRRIAEWTYRVRKGAVAQIRTHTEIARRNLEFLEDQGKYLGKEVDEIDKLMRKTKNQLQKTNDNKEREELRTALNNLETRADELGEALSANLQERFDAQRAIFDAAMSRFEQKTGYKDTKIRILELEAEISGGDNSERIRQILGQRGNILEAQRERIQRELNRARRRGDDELARELKQALLDNKLAILENTQSLDDVSSSIKQIFGFNSSAWQTFRQAIFDGMGGILPQYSIPQMETGGYVKTGGLAHLHAAEVVLPKDQVNGKIDINITEPMEVADPIALSNAIAFKLKTNKTY